MCVFLFVSSFFSIKMFQFCGERLLTSTCSPAPPSTPLEHTTHGPPSWLQLLFNAVCSCGQICIMLRRLGQISTLGGELYYSHHQPIRMSWLGLMEWNKVWLQTRFNVHKNPLPMFCFTLKTVAANMCSSSLIEKLWIYESQALCSTQHHSLK